MINELQEKVNEIATLIACLNYKDASKIGAILINIDEALVLIDDDIKDSVEDAFENMSKVFESLIMREIESSDETINLIADELSNIQNNISEYISTGAVAPKNLEDSSNSNKTVSTISNISVDIDTIKDYVGNSLEVPDELEHLFLEFEKDSSNLDKINEIFRIVHTLKGETGFAGMGNINALMHSLESVFALYRKTPQKINNNISTLFLKISDILKKNFEIAFKDPETALAQNFDNTLDRLLLLKKSVEDGTEFLPKLENETTILEKDIERLDLATVEDVDIIRDFIVESAEHLEVIENKILELEDAENRSDILNDIFRPLHTIKGVAGFLDFNHINKVAHESETFLDLARTEKIFMDKEAIDFVLLTVDTLSSLLSLIDFQIKGQDFLDEDYPDIDEYLTSLKSFIAEKLQDDVQSEEITLEKVKKVGEVLVDNNSIKKEDLDNALEIQKNSVENKKVGEILVEQKKVAPRQVVNALREQKASKVSINSGNIKVATDKLDSLINMVGELVISQTQIDQSPTITNSKDVNLSKNISQLSNIVRDIQFLSMSLRMVPVKATFQKMSRLVRDLSQKFNKTITLEINGADTELDRNVIEQINDPLVHMIRNSIDHGIESAEEREKVGKNKIGKVSLNAYHQGGNIVIEIKDDGKGLNRDAIKAKAIEKGILTENQSIDDNDLNNLIFHPGFSTAKKVTDVSGRGVGMDVVKKNIEKLNGTVIITSEPGIGSVFTIRLPLTMAIMDGMILRVGKEKYLIPILSIREAIRPKKEDITAIHGKGELVKVRDSLVQLIRLDKIFNLDADTQNLEESIVLIVEFMGKPYGFVADALLGQQQVVIKSLSGDYKNLEGFSGCAILGDGRVGLILDVKGVVDIACSKDNDIDLGILDD